MSDGTKEENILLRAKLDQYDIAARSHISTLRMKIVDVLMDNDAPNDVVSEINSLMIDGLALWRDNGRGSGV